MNLSFVRVEPVCLVHSPLNILGPYKQLSKEPTVTMCFVRLPKLLDKD